MNPIAEPQIQSRFQKILVGAELMGKVEELTNTAAWQVFVATGKVEWSDEMYHMYGYKPGSFEPSLINFFENVHPDDLVLVQNAFNKNEVSADFKQLEYKIIDKHDVLKYIRLRYLIRTDTADNGIKITGFAKDITKIKILELQLKDSQAYYKATIENSMSAFFVANSKGEILETNDVACRMFGYTNDELRKLNTHEILVTDDPKFITALQHLNITGRMSGEVVGIKKSGESLLLKFTSTRFLDANNEDRIISSVIDITFRKLQEETLLKSNERFEHVSKATFDAIWDWDVKSKELYFGDRFKELFGYEIQNNTGDFATWYRHIHPEDKERVILSRLNKIIQRSESTWKDEYRYLRADGSIAYISDRGILLRNSIGTYRMIGVMQDVTELKEKEIAISNLNMSLKKRAEELAISNEELERFAYVASHDLQEPLRMVTSFLQLLQKKYNNELDETAQKYISYAVDGADRMKTLILDLLDYSRISSDKNNHAVINLNELMGKTLQVLKPLVDESEASIIVSILPEIGGNTSQLMRLFQNLISNALKYRSALKPIIEIGCAEKDSEWEFFVKDNGIGIEAKYFEKIFVIFKRLHSRSEYSGTGIGLAICKKIVDLHRGTIWVESSVQAGSQFYFTVPKFKMPEKAVSNVVSGPGELLKN